MISLKSERCSAQNWRPCTSHLNQKDAFLNLDSSLRLICVVFRYDFVFLINSRRLCLSSRWNRAWNVHCQSRRVSSCWQEGSTTSETFRRSTFWRNKYSWHKRDWKSSDCFRSFGRILRSFPAIEGWSRGGPRVLPRGERTTGENRSPDVRETAKRENESKSRKWRLGQGSFK